jgi:hypothetical protein
MRLAAGQTVATPLLVPSFSSRGFGAIRPDPERPEDPERSVVSELLEFFAREIHETFLVSAYDLHHRFLEAGDNLDSPDWTANPLSNPRVMIIDSGGYEVRQGVDGGELIQDLRTPRPWDEQTYGELLDRLPEAAVNCAAVAWDRPGKSYEIQIRAAQDFLGGRSRLTPIMLLKPEDENRPHNWKLLESNASRLGFFSVIGVTEDELGSSLLDRVVAVMELRELLRRNELDKPIHIFGALDPLFVPVYFAAGADIFDGLTWLRYAYWHGLAVHHRQGPLLSGQAEQRDEKRFWAVPAANLSELQRLHSRLLRFKAENEDWSVYDDTMLGRSGERAGDILRSIYLSALARRTF